MIEISQVWEVLISNEFEKIDLEIIERISMELFIWLLNYEHIT